MFHNKETIHVKNVDLNVSSLSAMKAFYENILGLTLVKSEDKKAAYQIADSDHTITLIEVEGASPEGHRAAGLFHIAILLPDRQSLADFILHIHQKGVRFGASDHHVSEAVYLNDPDGNGYEVYRDRGDHDWIWNEDKVYMITEQLDINDIVSEHSDAGWQGLPDGSVFGHLHLKTHNVAEALPFYIEEIGLEIATDYPGAMFMSDKKYHHHIAINAWQSNAPRENNETTLGLRHVDVHHPAVENKDLVSPDGMHFTLSNK